ncbi:MAG: response regulator transcription factor [Terriglobales bacterium]
MASTPVTARVDAEQLQPAEGNGQFIRVIVADTQAIFRAGLRKIFALEDDVRVVGQAETLAQTLTAAKKFTADVLLFEAAIASNPIEAVADLLRQSPTLRMVVVTTEPDQDLTLELFRRGVHAIVSREVEPELLVDCLRKVAKGEPWLDGRATQWVLEAYRTQGSRAGAPRPKVQLTPKEALIVSCVTQGMKNKEIATRVGTTEQVVKNYLRKVYDKLGVADRLELALYCLNSRILDTSVKDIPVKDGPPKPPAIPGPTNGSASALVSAIPDTTDNLS